MNNNKNEFGEYEDFLEVQSEKWKGYDANNRSYILILGKDSGDRVRMKGSINVNSSCAIELLAGFLDNYIDLLEEQLPAERIRDVLYNYISRTMKKKN